MDGDLCRYAAELSALLEDAAERGPEALCSLVALCRLYGRRAERALAAAVGPVTAEGTVTRGGPALAPAEEDAALTATQAARETGWRTARDRQPGERPAGFSARWFYDHARELPFAIRPGGRAVRFSRAGLRAWLAAGGRDAR